MNNMKVSPKRVAHVVGEGGLWTRRDIASALGREKTTHVITQIELAVQLGFVERLPGYAGNREAWVYCVPGYQRTLPGFEHA